MSNLFHRLQPASKFQINIRAIAQLLNIPEHLIVRVECWKYVVFVHRRDSEALLRSADRGGQFISYRKLQHWYNAIACQIQNCETWQQLRQLWLAMEKDYKKYKKQYLEQSYQLLQNIWEKRWDLLWSEPISTS